MPTAAGSGIATAIAALEHARTLVDIPGASMKDRKRAKKLVEEAIEKLDPVLVNLDGPDDGTGTGRGRGGD